MIAKWIGAALIICACAGFGLQMKYLHLREEKFLEELREILLFITTELQDRLTPLPVLCHKVTLNCKGNLCKIFDAYGKELDKQLSPNPHTCMLTALEQFTNIPASTVKLLRRLGETLGKYDYESQLRTLNDIQEECEYCLNRLRTNKDTRIRTYQTLGLCAGAALAILFV